MMNLGRLKELCERHKQYNEAVNVTVEEEAINSVNVYVLADTVPLLLKVIENMASDLQLLDKCYKMYEADSDSQDLVVQAVRIPLEITMAETIKAYFDKAEKEIKDEN